MKKILLFILGSLLIINGYAQNYSYVINKTYDRYYDLNAKREISATNPVPTKLILTHKRDADSLIWVTNSTTTGYRILPESVAMREDNNRMHFIIDAKNDRYAYVIIAVNYGEWLKDNTYDILKNAYIMINPCTKKGEPISGKSGMKITVFTIKEILQHE